MHTCCLRARVASTLLQQLHEQLILELRSLQALMQQLLHNLNALSCTETLLMLIHVSLNASEHLDSSAGIVMTELQQGCRNAILHIKDRWLNQTAFACDTR